jgi:RNA polymerase sigma-70 factor, ECF subfamily
MHIEPARTSDDRVLAEAILRDGDERAFSRLYDRHTGRLLGFITRLVARAPAEAEDLTQETWVRACRGLERFQWNSSFSTWLLGIGLNVVRDYLRRHNRGVTVDMDAIPEVPAPAIPQDERIDLERAIALLPDGYRMILVLHDVEGMTHDDIAGALEISAGTSKSQLSRARTAMRRLLSPDKETES